MYYSLSLINFAVTARLIFAFVFAYAYCWFSHDLAHYYYVVCVINFKNQFRSQKSLEEFE